MILHDAIAKERTKKDVELVMDMHAIAKNIVEYFNPPKKLCAKFQNSADSEGRM